MNNLREILVQNPIIAAVRDDAELREAIESDVAVVFVLYGNILNISEICRGLKEKGKIVFVHVDLIEGLRGDSSGIKYIKEMGRPDGIISTKSSNIKYGNHLGMITIQRIFAVDSLSLKTGIKNINENSPNAVEVMPGVAYNIIEGLQNEISSYIIAGGLIKSKKDVINALSAGAIAISTTAANLWKL
ncbi:glycerol-3-phosphate responsive antiterminator [Clostridium sp. JN-9]|uniref:glycerol-3-phosphate responsive antiterminator n=1 Tax=Clostridium sp. JN-9 TaxID=2507159 RepID=UPI000FFE200D|nr:glycerol-3-phosphate responsive antiterminator [Clostridium sp. JN-9]QAT40576.1 glycerol-3-phosphate responsive antiterminator [Clostridium sp. JN-9]